MKTLFALVLCLLPNFVCAQTELAGVWDCWLTCPGGPLRFVINVEHDSAGKTQGWVVNGSERIQIPSLKLENDQFIFDFDHYDSKIRCTKTGDKLKGTWKKRRGLDHWVTMEFHATKMADENRSGNRLGADADSGKSPFEGRWLVDFDKSDDPAVGIFKRGSRNTIEGTFLTTTGDYRFLHGRVDDMKMELSCFDGAHAFLFRATFESSKLAGDFWSSNTWHESWTAVPKAEAKLPDAFAETKFVKEQPLGSFVFPDLNGEMRKLNDPAFGGDAKLIYIFGSWCPNCHDAAAYFKELQKKYGEKLSIVGLAFEHTGEFQRDAAQVRKYLKRHNVNYPVLIAGTSDKSLASKSVPFIDKVRSYPTTLFLNSVNEVQAIHTGFTGPATGQAFENLKQKFTQEIDEIIRESLEK